MKPLLLRAFMAVLGAVALLASASAQSAVTYSPGDLLLGFRASTGIGATQDYVVNIGQASVFNAATGTMTVSGLGSIATDLAALFGADWNTRSDVFWSVSGTPGSFAAVGTDPLRTLYATREELVVGSVGTSWLRQSGTTQGSTTSKMNAFANAFAGKTSTASSSKAIIQSGSDANSYASFQQGGPLANAGPAPGISFAAFNPTIEGSFANGTVGTVLDLCRMAPASGVDVGSAGDVVGRFTFSNEGVLSFTPAAAVGSSSVELSSATYSVLDTAGTVSVTLKRSGDPTTAFTVNLSTTAGTAFAGTDYTAQPNTSVSFAINQSEATVPVTITHTTGFQANRSFTVGLSVGSGATLGTATSATVTISDGDPNTSGTIAFGAASYHFSSLSTGNVANDLVVTLTRSGGSTGAVSADVTATGGTLLNGTNYTYASPSTVSFADGATSATTHIQLNTLSAAGTIILTLSNSTGGTSIGTQSTAVLNVALAPGYISYSAATYQKVIGSSDATLTITATRTAGSTGAVSADVSVGIGSTATLGTDYTLPSSTVILSWANGDSAAKTFVITVKSTASVALLGDTILLGLTNLTGSALTGTVSAATVIITPIPDAVVPTVTVTSPAANATVTAASVSMSGTATDNIGVTSVTVSLNGGTAQAATLSGTGTSVTWTLAGLVPNQGTNTLTVISADAQSNPSATLTRTFKFANLRPALGGVYNGLLTATVNGVATNHHGLARITVSKTGTFTGKLSLSGVIVPITGIFATDGAGAFGVTKTASVEISKTVAKVKTSLGYLALTLDTAGGRKITGTMKDVTGATTYADVNADQALYAAKPVTPYVVVPTAVLNPLSEKGRYTCILPSSGATNNTVLIANFPQGDGYGTLTVSAAGVVKVLGKLADGTAVSYSNSLSQSNKWPVYLPLYGKKGFVFGNVAFDSTQTSSDASCTGMLWFRPAGVTSPKLYLAGWPAGITTDFVASKFIPTGLVNTATVLGAGATGAVNAATANITITTADGGLTAATSNQGSLSALNKITVLGPSALSSGATNLKFAFTASTGTFAGSFMHQVSSKVVTFGGVVYQKTKTGSGYFLYLPLTAPTGASSGSVGVSAP